MKSNIVLIGFMGTGKTAVGKRLANILKMEFLDTDLEVEAVTGMSISQLFERYGETRFRSEENLAVKRVALNENCIIATGGGMVLDQSHINLLAEKGIIICLSARPDVIYERVKRRNNRPLLKKGDLFQTILDLLEERKELYECAECYIDTSDMDFNEIIDRILNFVNEYRQKEENIADDTKKS